MCIIKFIFINVNFSGFVLLIHIKSLRRYFSGMVDMGKDPDYCEAYNDLQFDNEDDPDMIKERIHFMKHIEDICMQMTLYQKKVMHEKDIYMMEADMTISSIVRLLDDRINHDDYERVNTRLQMHENMLRENLMKKIDIRRQLFILKFVSFLTPFLIGMRKRMKIPDTTRFLPDLSGTAVLQLLPLILQSIPPPPLPISSSFQLAYFMHAVKKELYMYIQVSVSSVNVLYQSFSSVTVAKSLFFAVMIIKQVK